MAASLAAGRPTGMRATPKSPLGIRPGADEFHWAGLHAIIAVQSPSPIFGAPMSMFTRGPIVFALGTALAMTARALPPLPKYVEEHYAGSPDYAKFVEKYKGLDMEHQCDACHKPGIDKKVKGHGLNDFGQAVARNFKHRDFNK